MQLSNRALFKVLGFVLFISIIFYACGKGGDGGGGGTPNPCAGVSISVTGTVADATTGSANGSIVSAAAGGTAPYTFSINGGAYQASGTFNNIAKGNYTITAKDSKGCTGSAPFAVNETNNCAGVVITLSAVTTSSDPCTGTGTVTATAAGSTNFTYSLDAGAFQASNVFNNISAGNHTLNVKDGGGCTKNTPANIGSLAAGPLFTAARSVIQNNCAIPGCHTGAAPQNGINFSVDCTIVFNKDRIKARAIDGNPSIMPPTGQLPQADRDKITAWLNAGGRFTD